MTDPSTSAIGLLADEKPRRIFVEVTQRLSATAEEVALSTKTDLNEILTLLDGLVNEGLLYRDDAGDSDVGGLPLYSPTAQGLRDYRSAKRTYA
jgi:hypothetical protein